MKPVKKSRQTHPQPEMTPVQTEANDGMLFITMAIPFETKKAAVPMANNAWDWFSAQSTTGGWFDARYVPSELPPDETPFTLEDL